MFTMFVAIALAAQDADCPTSETAAGRYRIASGELSCAEQAKRALPPRPITPKEQRRITVLFDDYLVDLPSARWRWGKVIQGSLACVSINSKNRMGGYTGWTTYTINLDTGEIRNQDDTRALLRRLDMGEEYKDPCF